MWKMFMKSKFCPFGCQIVPCGIGLDWCWNLNLNLNYQVCLGNIWRNTCILNVGGDRWFILLRLRFFFPSSEHKCMYVKWYSGLVIWTEFLSVPGYSVPQPRQIRCRTWKLVGNLGYLTNSSQPWFSFLQTITRRNFVLQL